MKIIYKYDIQVLLQFFTIIMHDDAQILDVQNQHNIARIWALIDDEKPTMERHFMIAGTGHSIKATNHKYIGTFQQEDGNFIWHLFELI